MVIRRDHIALSIGTGISSAETDWVSSGEAAGVRHPRRRLRCLALMLDQVANVLLVRPVNAGKDEWCLPGRTARATEEPRGALKRAAQADLGLTVPAGRMLVMDYVPASPHGYELAGWDLVFECGLLPEGVEIRLNQERLTDARFVSLDDLEAYTSEAQARRVRAAVDASIVSVGAYRPSRVVSNQEVCARIQSSDDWIRRRSGIVTRRLAGPDETVVGMGAEAAVKALAQAGVDPGEVGVVLLASMSHLEQSPAAAPRIAALMGASSAAAADVSAACAGFCYALGLADALVRTGSHGYVVVIGSEKMSDIIDPHDRSTAFLFGDGRCARVRQSRWRRGSGTALPRR